MVGPQVWSLAGELRSHIACAVCHSQIKNQNLLNLVLWYLDTCKSFTYSTSIPHNPPCPYCVISSVNTNLNIQTGTQGRS